MSCAACRRYLREYGETIQLARAAFAPADDTEPVPEPLLRSILNACRRA